MKTKHDIRLQNIAAELAGMNVDLDKVSVGPSGVTLKHECIHAVLDELERHDYYIIKRLDIVPSRKDVMGFE